MVNSPNNKTHSVQTNFNFKKHIFLENNSANLLGVAAQWAGYLVTTVNASGPSYMPNSVTMVRGSWVVQPVPQLTFPPTYSAQWIGVGGAKDSDLIQVGTESTSISGVVHGSYYAVFELVSGINGNQTLLTTNNSLGSNGIFALPIRGGDIINSEISLMSQNATNQNWFILISDQNQRWVADGTLTLNSFSMENSAEFIEEDPCENSGCGELQPFADFGSSSYGYDFTHNFLSNQVTLSNKTVFIGSLPEIPIYMQHNGQFSAKPDPITPDGTSFGVTYGNLSINVTKSLLGKGNSGIETLNLSAIPSGYSSLGNLTYTWYNSTDSFPGLQIGNGKKDYIHINNISANAIYTVFVTDKGLSPHPQAYNYIELRPLATSLESPVITPSPIMLDSGQSINLTAWDNFTPVAGTLVWQWYKQAANGSFVAIPNANHSVLQISNVTADANYEVSVYLSTKNKNTALFSLPTQITVYPSLGIPTVAPSSITIRKGQSVNLTVLETGGTGDYIYAWYTVAANSLLTPVGEVSSKVFTVSPNATTTYEVAALDLGVTPNATPPAREFSAPVSVIVAPPVTYVVVNTTFTTKVLNNTPIQIHVNESKYGLPYADSGCIAAGVTSCQEWQLPNGTVVNSFLEGIMNNVIDSNASALSNSVVTYWLNYNWGTAASWPYNETERIYVSNIVWGPVGNFISYANGTASLIIYNTAPRLLLLNLTHSPAMGVGCHDVYMQGWNGLSQTSLGSLNFSVINCTGAVASFVVSAYSRANQTFNALYLYYGNNAVSGLADAALGAEYYGPQSVTDAEGHIGRYLVMNSIENVSLLVMPGNGEDIINLAHPLPNGAQILLNSFTGGVGNGSCGGYGPGYPSLYGSSASVCLQGGPGNNLSAYSFGGNTRFDVLHSLEIYDSPETSFLYQQTTILNSTSTSAYLNLSSSIAGSDILGGMFWDGQISPRSRPLLYCNNCAVYPYVSNTVERITGPGFAGSPTGMSYVSQVPTSVDFVGINGNAMIVEPTTTSYTLGSVQSFFTSHSSETYNAITGNYTIALRLAIEGSPVLNGLTTGEAPQISQVYAEFDDCASVFTYCNDFAGSSLSGWTSYSQDSLPTVTVDNRLTIDPTGNGWAGIYSDSVDLPSSYAIDFLARSNGPQHVLGGQYNGYGFDYVTDHNNYTICRMVLGICNNGLMNGGTSPPADVWQVITGYTRTGGAELLANGTLVTSTASGTGTTSSLILAAAGNDAHPAVFQWVRTRQPVSSSDVENLPNATTFNIA